MKFIYSIDKIIPLGILLTFVLFLHGFFPMKRHLPGFAVKNTTLFLGRNLSQPDKMFDKLVIVLIDALRDDFVFEKNFMPFLKSKIEEGTGRHFTLRAHPPTVTLPRIKALTTGSIPGFVDIVLNLDSSEIGGDNIISQAYRDNQRIAFYGDDTWIKLFPQHFTHSDGTTSFFVTDYTEVDDNVTRHLDARLSNLDWDLMILHYLGLDHIGHTAGPNSPLVVTKLAEMDGIVYKLYSNLEKQDEKFALLVCGDHGMSDQGSHGGATDREVMVPAVFLSPKYGQTDSRWRSLRELLQIDLASTLSVLLGLPIPNNNLGQVLMDVLDGYTDSEKLNLLFINSQQVLRLMEQNVADFTKERSYELYVNAIQLHENYSNQSSSNKPTVSMVMRGYETAMDAMATKISKSLTTYDMYSMMVAVLILFLCLLHVGLQTFNLTVNAVSFATIHVFLLLGLAGFGHVTVCTSQSYSSSILCGRSLISVGVAVSVWITIVPLMITVSQQLKKLNQHKVPHFSCIEVLLLVGTLMHSMSFLSSSFVEEEHQTWYFLSMTLYLFVLIHLTVRSITINNKLTYDITRVLNEKNNGKTFDSYDKKQSNGHFECETKANAGYYLLDRNKKSDGRSEISSLYHSLDRETNSQGEDTKSARVKKKKLEIIFPYRQIVAMVIVMCIGRFLRTINQTGNKWLNIPDFGDWLGWPENKSILTYINIGSLIAIGLMKVRELSVRSALCVLGLTGCHFYRISTGTILNVFMIPGYNAMSKGISEAHFVYGIITLMIIFTIIKLIQTMFYCPLGQNDRAIQLIQSVETLQLAWILFMALLLRPHNTIFVAMVTLQEQLLWKHFITKMTFPVWCQTLICWWIGQAIFFQQGNSNSISTVDVSAGYVGQEDYQPALVGSLLYCSTYAGPVFWLLTLLKSLLYHPINIQQQQSREKHTDYIKRLQTTILQCIQTLSLERLFTLCLYCTVVTVERYHLFVWTVFSPKLLYEGMLTVTYVIFTTVLGLISSLGFL